MPEAQVASKTGRVTGFIISVIAVTFGFAALFGLVH